MDLDEVRIRVAGWFCDRHDVRIPHVCPGDDNFTTDAEKFFAVGLYFDHFFYDAESDEIALRPVGGMHDPLKRLPNAHDCKKLRKEDELVTYAVGGADPQTGTVKRKEWLGRHPGHVPLLVERK